MANDAAWCCAYEEATHHSVNIRMRLPKHEERPGVLIGRWDATIWLVKARVRILTNLYLRWHSTGAG